ncbi:hypothetical protein D3C86_1368420 [compost metagenome]
MDGFGDASCKIDVVVFEHDHIVEGKSVVLSSSYLYGPFFDGSDAGRSLSGVEYFGAGAF